MKKPWLLQEGSSIVKEWKHKDLDCLVVQNSMPVVPISLKLAPTSWMCGYVQVPRKHPLYGKDGGELLAPGGITFSEKSNGGWSFGFDTMHYSNMRYKTVNDADYVVKCVNELAEQISDFKPTPKKPLRIGKKTIRFSVRSKKQSAKDR